MTDYKLLKIMKKISRIKKDEIKISEIMKLVKLNNNDLYTLVNELLNNGYIEKSKTTIFIDSLDYVQDYRVTNKGYVFLRKSRNHKILKFLNEFKNWMALFIAIAALSNHFLVNPLKMKQREKQSQTKSLHKMDQTQNRLERINSTKLSNLELYTLVLFELEI